MKKSLLKDSVRQIKNTFKRFLSILLIVLLGVGFFAGMQATSPDMKEAVDEYFDAQNMMDIEVISTLGLTEEDINALKNVEGVSQVNPAYSFDASINADAISASIEDSAIEPNNTDLETGVQEPISDDDLEAEVKEPLDWTEAIAQHIKEMADVLDEVQRKAKEEAQKLDDLASAPEDPENTLCPGK